MSPDKNTSASTGKKYKKQVFCLNLVDSIFKCIQILKVKLKLLVLSLYIIFPFHPRMADNYLWIWYEKNVLVFPYWTYLLPTAPWKCWNLFYLWLVLQVAICSSATRGHRSCTLDSNERALSCFVVFCLLANTVVYYLLWVNNGLDP